MKKIFFFNFIIFKYMYIKNKFHVFNKIPSNI